ncbi:MGMT family protein [Ruicaihuangia caeni]|uniref:MGMT family protein n=1 Tax=Ruicaihuangia caeni TaxID=3042517 RepID=UPI00338D4CED
MTNGTTASRADRLPSPAGGAPTGDAFTAAVLEIVAAIPAGRVMSYGDIAAALGSNAARRVGQIMAWHGDGLPWWRVVRASGEPPACHEGEALEHYLAEGTPLTRRGERPRIDLRSARHRP